MYFACSKCKTHTYVSVDNEYTQNIEKYHEMAHEWLDVNTARSIPYMGENRPVMSL